MRGMSRRVQTLEADHAKRPLSQAGEKTIRARMWAKLQLIGAGRELPACCLYDRSQDDPKTRESRERLLARLERMNDNDVEPVKFMPLPDNELDRLEQFLIGDAAP